MSSFTTRLGSFVATDKPPMVNIVYADSNPSDISVYLINDMDQLYDLWPVLSTKWVAHIENLIDRDFFKLFVSTREFCYLPEFEERTGVEAQGWLYKDDFFLYLNHE